MNVLFLDRKRKDEKEVGFVMDVPTVPREGEYLRLGEDREGTVQGIIWTFQCDGSKADAIVLFK